MRGNGGEERELKVVYFLDFWYTEKKTGGIADMFGRDSYVDDMVNQNVINRFVAEVNIKLVKLGAWKTKIAPADMGGVQALHIIACSQHVGMVSARRRYDKRVLSMAGCYADSRGSTVVLVCETVEKISGYLAGCTEQLRELTVSKAMLGELDVSHLTGLQKLELTECTGLTSVLGLRRLKALRFLRITGDYPVSSVNLSDFPELESVELNIDELKHIWIEGELPRCRSLRVPGSRIGDADFLQYLPNLEHLRLRSGERIKFPAWLPLAKLTHLDLSGARLWELPRLRCFGGLTHLDLSGTSQISLDKTAFPDTLVSLDLSMTQLREIPDGIRKLDRLQYLGLRNLELTQLPHWLPALNLPFSTDYAGRGISLFGSEIRGVDMSIFDQPREVIVEWFEERRKAAAGGPLNEVKVVFLGDGDAGKSHTIARLLNDGGAPENFDGNSTPGIAITDKSYSMDGREVRVHFWDFGGQEILHSMHRMFLTKRTLYVILINARYDTQDDRARYWLHNVRSFAGTAPVLLVLNKMDQNPNASVNETDLRSICPGLTEVVKLSAKYDDQETFNARFTEVLKRRIGAMENLDFFFPASWTRAKQHLLDMTDNYIRGSDYAAICDECGVTDEGGLRRSLLSWFHDLGVSICYGGNARLRDYVILRPNWITNAVYAILFNNHPDTRNGIISHDAVFEMIQPSGEAADPYRRTDPAERYTQAEIDYILGVTRKFRLSFRVGDAHEFIPMLCRRESLPIAAEYAADPNALAFRMTFDYLPGNVLHRLMVELRQDLDTTQVWRTGAHFVQKSSGLSAVVKSEGDTLLLFVRGAKQSHRPNTYLCILKDAIDHIVKDMNLARPFNEVMYRLEGKTQAFDYDELVESLEYGETTRYSRVHRRRLKIEDILNQTGRQPDEARKKLVEDMIAVCGQMQANRQNRNACEDDRNTYIRDLLRAKGYFVADQTLSGKAVGGKRAGELDLQILDGSDRPWTLCEAMNLSGKGGSQMEYWNAHLQKLLGCYDANGLPFLFLISYVDGGAEKFGELAAAYYEHLRFYSSGEYTLQAAEPLTAGGIYREQNQYIQTARCIYDREGFPTTVYHIFVRMGE